MKAIKASILLISYLLMNGNSIHAQMNMIKSDKGNSCIYESVTGIEPTIGIGIQVPVAKLHISAFPANQTLLKSDAYDQIGSTPYTIGSVECWKKNQNVYYGIYQSSISSYSVNNYFQNNLGINVPNPTHILDVNGIIGCTGSNSTGVTIRNGSQPFVFTYYGINYGNFDIGGNGNPPADTSHTPLTLNAWGVGIQSILECPTIRSQNFKMDHNATAGSLLMSNDTYGNSAWTDPAVFSITDGRVGIGAANNYTDYKLAVNGKMICTELKVKLFAQWPDFVFNRGHKLCSLYELDQFIQKNNHLPDVPTAQEVEKDGIKVGEMNTILLKKVEELTVYIIAMQKEMDQLKAKISGQ